MCVNKSLLIFTHLKRWQPLLFISLLFAHLLYKNVIHQRAVRKTSMVHLYEFEAVLGIICLHQNKTEHGNKERMWLLIHASFQWGRISLDQTACIIAQIRISSLQPIPWLPTVPICLGQLQFIIGFLSLLHTHYWQGKMKIMKWRQKMRDSLADCSRRWMGSDSGYGVSTNMCSYRG